MNMGGNTTADSVAATATATTTKSLDPAATSTSDIGGWQCRFMYVSFSVDER